LSNREGGPAYATRSSGARAALALAAALLLSCSTLLLSCSNSGGSGSDKKRTILLSTEYDDLAVGEEAAREIEAEMGLYDSPALTAYVGEVGRRLVAYAPLRPFQYTFQVIDQMSPNAFSLPGGHIYVSRGLIALASSEAELAGVLGHEIIHAAERHAAAQQELARRTSPFLMPYIRMARLAGYSRDHERAADKGGQTIAAKAGYDPAALAEFLKHLGDSERLAIGYSRLTSYFDTHPGTTERVASTAARAMTIDWKPDPIRSTDRGTYLRRIEGVVLGPDPAEGIFRETEFAHPDLDFRILFPRGWTLVNTRQAVGAVSPDNNARCFITLEPPLRAQEASEREPGRPEPAEIPGQPEDSTNAQQDPAQGASPGTPPPPSQTMPTPREAAERMVREPRDGLRVNVQREGTVRIGEIEAYRLDVEGSMGPASIGGQITFIPHAGFLFRLTCVAAASSWSSYVGRAHTTARTFRPLTESERNSVEVLHLRLARAIEGEGITDLSQRVGNSWGPGRTAVLNGIFVDARFEDGELLKIARSVPYTPRPDPTRSLETSETDAPH
jgi:predicted Zn-dependent protease